MLFRSDTDTDSGKKDTGDSGRDTGPPDTDPHDTGPRDSGPPDTAPVDGDGDGFPAGVDCDDSDPSVTAGDVFYADADGDGSGDGSSPAVVACTPPGGYVGNQDDCDDTDAAINLGGVEDCDGVDENCNGLIDDNPADGTTYYTDSDLDGYGDPAAALIACGEDTGVVSNYTDCDDGDSTISPAATEDATNGVDDDCDGVTDEGTVEDASGWSVIGDMAGDALGSAVWAVSDADDDGLDELVIGYPSYDGASPDVGALAISDYTSAADEAAFSVATVVITGVYSGDSLGSAFASLGDDDGDGVSTLVVGASLGDPISTDEGAVYIFDGSLTGTVDASTLQQIAGVDASSLFGASIVGGDLDGDGATELLGGAPGTTSGAGSVFWFTDLSAASTGDGAELTGSSAESLGESLAVFDYGADGTDDLIACAPEGDRGSRTAAGACYVVEGADMTADAIGDLDVALFLGENTDDHLGRGANALTTGDIDGDGQDDVAIAMPGYDGTGTDDGAVVFFTGTAIGTRNVASSATLFVIGDGGLSTVASPADLDADGALDLVLGASTADIGGAVYTVDGTATGTVTLPGDAARAWTAAATGDGLGASVGGGFDLDVDGAIDLVAGATGSDGGGNADAGEVYVFAGQ